MKQRILFLILITLACAFSAQAAIVSYIGDNRTGRRNENKYSLNSIRKNNSYSLSSVRNPNLQFHNQSAAASDDREYTAPVLIQKGNMTISYNFKFKVTPSNPVPLFKAPSRSSYMQ